MTARARAVDPTIFFVRILVNLLTTMIECSLDTTHTADRVHQSISRAQATVVAQPLGGQGSGCGACRAATPTTYHTYDRVGTTPGARRPWCRRRRD